MNNNKRLLQYIPFSLFLLFFVPLSWAQDSEDFLVINNAEHRYIQSFSWAGDENTLHYEILIEKEEEGSFQRVRQEFTDEAFIEFALPPGKYRCRVIPYDFLNRPGEGSEWIDFAILSTGGDNLSKPEIIIAEPDASDKPDTKEPETPVPPESRTQFEVYINAHWTSVFPVYSGEDAAYNWNHSLSGAEIRLGIVSSGQRPVNLGVELAVSHYYFNSGLYGSKTEVQSLEVIDFSLLAQRWLSSKRTAAFNLRVGDGFSLTQKNTSSFHITAGASFLWRPAKNFFLEAGLDYTHLFDWKPPESSSTEESPGIIRSWFGVGLRF